MSDNAQVQYNWWQVFVTSTNGRKEKDYKCPPEFCEPPLCTDGIARVVALQKNAFSNGNVSEYRHQASDLENRIRMISPTHILSPNIHLILPVCIPLQLLYSLRLRSLTLRAFLVLGFYACWEIKFHKTYKGLRPVPNLAMLKQGGSHSTERQAQPSRNSKTRKRRTAFLVLSVNWVSPAERIECQKFWKSKFSNNVKSLHGSITTWRWWMKGNNFEFLTTEAHLDWSGVYETQN